MSRPIMCDKCGGSHISINLKFYHTEKIKRVVTCKDCGYIFKNTRTILRPGSRDYEETLKYFLIAIGVPI